MTEEYEAQRRRNAAEEARRQREIAEKAPEVARLSNERHSLILSGIRSMLESGEKTDLESLMRGYNAKIHEALRDHGYPEDYLEPVYRCSVCRDTGLAGEGVRRECACFTRRLRELEDQENGGSAESFEAFDIHVFPVTPVSENGITQRMYMKTVRKKVEAFADSYPETYRNLCLHGSSGLGKTYLMRCVARRLRERGLDAVYVTAYRLLDDLRSDYFRPGSRDTSPYFEADLLLIDDLGMEPLFESITVEVFCNVLNERTLRSLGTAVSTNLTRVEMEKRYTERFISRLLDSRICLDVPFWGSDLRMVRQKENP